MGFWTLNGKTLKEDLHGAMLLRLQFLQKLPEKWFSQNKKIQKNPGKELTAFLAVAWAYLFFFETFIPGTLKVVLRCLIPF